MREPGRIRDRRALVAGAVLTWDERFLIAVERLAAPAMLGALGDPAQLPPRRRPAGVPAAALAALPALWRDGRPVACPPVGWDEPGSRVRADFRAYVAITTAPFAGPIVV
jgi:hypothetical protein